MSFASAKVPAVIVSGVICLCAGAGIMFVIQPYIVPVDPHAEVTPAKGAAVGKVDPNAASAKMGMKGMKGGGGGGGGAKGQSPKTQLTQLVTKLDALTVKPLKFELTADQKK
ncbi:MAG TPA: hypothetical protein VG097_16150, partial [Gemmata sp.]|nr:hypothetical protein [Gemmata sp.]